MKFVCDTCDKSEECNYEMELPSGWTLLSIEKYHSKASSPLGLIAADRYTMHFCSKSCLVERLFPDSFIKKVKTHSA